MPQFMDYHDDLRLPGEAVQQNNEDTKSQKVEQSSVFARSSSITTPRERCIAS